MNPTNPKANSNTNSNADSNNQFPPEANQTSLWLHKNYISILIANLTSSFGTMMYQVAFFWLAYKLTSSAFSAGMVILASTSPYLLFGLIGGVYADRWNRKKVSMWSNLLTALIVSIIPVAIWSDHLTAGVLGITAFIVMSIRCFFNPAIRALIPQTLPENLWQKGNTVWQISTQLSRSIAPALAGVFIAGPGTELVFILYVLLLLISFAATLSVKIAPRKMPTEKVGVVKDIISTFQFVSTIKPLFWSIMLFGLVLLIYTGMERIGLPDVSDNVWEMEARGFGIIMATFGIGNILGAFILGKMNIKNYSKIIFSGWMIWGITLGWIGLTDWFYLAVALAIVNGISESMNDLPMVLMIQRLVPDDKLGKVFSMWSTTAFIGESGSSILCGFVIGWAGLNTSFFLVALALTLIGALGFFLVGHVSDETSTATMQQFPQQQ